jgi:hypothetical protein
MQKETIIVNQPGNNHDNHYDNHYTKERLEVRQRSCNGAGVGAATGAIISRKKVQGAIIGGGLEPGWSWNRCPIDGVDKVWVVVGFVSRDFVQLYLRNYLYLFTHK